MFPVLFYRSFQPTWMFDEKAATSCLLLAGRFHVRTGETFPHNHLLLLTRDIGSRRKHEKPGNAAVGARHFCVCAFLQVTATFLSEDICF